MTIYEKISNAKDMESLENIRKSINEACDERKKVIEICTRANELSQNSYGFLKEAFENMSPKLFESKEGKKVISKYTKLMKENKNLSSLHALYENVRKADGNSDIDFFVNNIVTHDWNINKKSIDEDIKKLGKVIAEGYITLNGDCEDVLPKENRKLSNALNFIAENKKSSKNIFEYSDAVKVIRDSINEKKEQRKKSMFEDVDRIAERLVNEFNEKYEGELNEEETKALKELAENTNSEEVFNKYKKMCDDRLTEAKQNFEKEGDIESAKKISTIQEQVAKKSFSDEHVGEDICNLIEMTKLFE